MRFDAMGLVFCASLLSGCFLDGAGRQQGADGGGIDAGSACGTVEICDGDDDDCDGVIDEDASLPCGTAGTCTAGTRACVGGELATACTPTGTTATEVCEGSVDEDCDGTVDEGCGCTTGDTRACGDETGACEAGTQTCGDSETWGPCTGAVGPVAETCNGADDDCDGTTDEAIAPEPCGGETGECTIGTRTCVGGALTDCSGTLPRAEVCDGAMLDEDCDGESNEGCECTPGDTEECGAGTCTGSRTCEAGGTWGACDAVAGAETCNGADDDCDGRVDEGSVSPLSPSPCTLGITRVQVNGPDGRSYVTVFSPTAGWVAAQTDCRSFGYELVTIETEAENDAILDAIGLARMAGGPSEYWIGLSDTSAAARDYRWPDMSLPAYDGWASGEPSHDNQCVMIDHDRTSEPSGGWDDKGCGGGRAYICESSPATP